MSRIRRERNRCFIQTCENKVLQLGRKYCSKKCRNIGSKIFNIHNKGKKASEETKKKMSIAHKGNQCAKGYKFTEEQRASLSVKRRNQKRPPMTEEGKRKISESLKSLYENGYQNPNKGTAISYERKMYLSEIASKQAETNVFIRSKMSYPYGIFCQSSSEAKFIEDYYEHFTNTLKCKITRGDTLKTPYGFYVPDFKITSDVLGMCYVEVKSTYTFKCLFGRNLKQKAKIDWVNENTDSQIIIFIT